MRVGLFVLFAFLPAGSPANAQSTDEAPLPLYTAEDLQLDPGRLKPHRLMFEPLSEIYDARFAKGRVQVHISLERGEYTEGAEIRPWTRVRWAASTHGYEDMGLLDGRSLALIHHMAPGSMSSLSLRHIFFGQGTASLTTLRPDSAATVRVRPLRHRDYYHVISVPYVMAASDLQPGERFLLPQYLYGAGRDTTFSVDVIGEVEMTDDRGEVRSVWRVDTDHGYARIQWYLDRENAPHLLGYTWDTVSDGEVVRSSTQWAHRWVPYPFDTYEGVIVAPPEGSPLPER